MNLYERIKAADRYYDMATCMTIMLSHSALRDTIGDDDLTVIDDVVISGALKGIATLLEEGNNIMLDVHLKLRDDDNGESETEAV